MRTTRLTGGAAAVTLALTLAACTGTGGGTDTAPEPDGGSATGDTAGTGDEAVTIRYLIQQLEDPATMDSLEQRLNQFADEAGFRVELESLPLESMRTVLQTQLRSGDGPDVFAWGTGPGFAGSLVDAGLVMDLTDAYDEYGWDVYEFARETVTFDGRVYGVPGEMETIGIFYNADLFAELGVEEPESLAELESAAATIADAGVIPFAVSDQEGWQGGHLLSMALSSRVGGDRIDALIAGEESWDNPDTIAALQTWQDFYDAGWLPPSPTSVSYDSANALFYAGEAAMLPTGSWMIDRLAEYADFEVRYIPFPAEDGPGIFTGGLGSGSFISAATNHPDEALQLVDFIASQEFGTWEVENLRTIPTFPVDVEEIDVSPLFRQVLDETATFSGGDGDTGQNIDVLMGDAFNEAMWNGVQGIFSDQRTPEQVAAELEAAAQR
jgi:raffinose/stachyose/melibiose transport system substrate-binding protein